VVLAGVYVALLIAVKEVGNEDWIALKGLLCSQIKK